MKKLFLLAFIAMGFQLSAQVQTFNTAVKYKVVTTGVDSPTTGVLVMGVDGLLQQLPKSLFGGGGSAITNHNDLLNIQGGSAGQYYHFNSTQHTKLLNLIYSNNTSSFSVTPSAGERGVSTAVTVNYNIIPNDDIFTGASINQGIGSVLSDVGTGAKTVSGGNQVANLTWTLSLNYTRNGGASSESKNATYTTYVPQWAGISSLTDFTATSAALNAEAGLQKFVQNGSAITKVVSPTAQYVWFVVTNPSGQILDGNNFVQTVGTWGDGTSEFYRKAVLVTLADSSTATAYFIRSRNTKTLTSFTYKSN